MYRVVLETIDTIKNDKDADAHIPIQANFKNGKPVVRLVNAYKKYYTNLAEGLTFQEAKKVRDENKGSRIVRQ